MTEQPQNLRKIKIEQSQLLTSKKSLNNIKERLNMHVKRRLQLPVELQSDSNASIMNEIHSDMKFKPLEPQPLKTRKYQRRTEKLKANNLQDVGDVCHNNARKPRRQKIKPIKFIAGVSGGNQAVGEGNDRGAVASISFTSASGNGGDDDGSQDGGGIGGCNEVETKSGREKEKCPDILGIVLSVKKRSLLQHPDVVAFLRKITTEMKN